MKKVGKEKRELGVHQRIPRDTRDRNPFYDRLRVRGQLGGQHSASRLEPLQHAMDLKDNVIARYEQHSLKGNTLEAARIEQAVMLEEFEAERQAAASEQGTAF